MLDEQACQQAIKEWLQERKGRPIVWSDDLALQDILDSVDFMELLLMIEQRYHLQVNPFDIALQDMASPQRIATFIAARCPR